MSKTSLITKVRDRGRGGAPDTKAEIPCSPWRTTVEQTSTLQPMERTMLEQRKSMKRREQQRGAVMDGPQTPLPIPMQSSGSEEAKESEVKD